jgi:hypothetical protein
MITTPNYTVAFTTTPEEGVRVRVTDTAHRTSVMTLEVYACWIHGLQTLSSYEGRRNVYDADDRKWICGSIDVLDNEAL